LSHFVAVSVSANKYSTGQFVHTVFDKVCHILVELEQLTHKQLQFYSPPCSHVTLLSQH